MTITTQCQILCYSEYSNDKPKISFNQLHFPPPYTELQEADQIFIRNIRAVQIFKFRYEQWYVTNLTERIKSLETYFIIPHYQSSWNVGTTQSRQPAANFLWETHRINYITNFDRSGFSSNLILAFFLTGNVKKRTEMIHLNVKMQYIKQVILAKHIKQVCIMCLFGAICT